MVVGSLRQSTEVVVIGAGPGGYVAALRAADLGKDVILVERRDRRGGVCLLEGCIPSKALIHAVNVMEEVRAAKKMGITVKDLEVDRERLLKWKESVVSGLCRGIDGLLEKRGVEVVTATARFETSTSLALEGAEASAIDFQHCIIATGSRPVHLPFTEGKGVWTSTEALQVPSVPARLLVIGAGAIGLELGQVYAGLGSKVVCVEAMESILPGADPDLAEVVERACRKRFEALHLESKVTALEGNPGDGYKATLEKKGGETAVEAFDQVLIAVGRIPATEDLGLENTRVARDPRGFIETDETCQTADPAIFAIGDVTRGPQLAHKASREAKVAAEVIAGRKAAFDNRAIPGVVYTDPEVAWTGLTELDAAEEGREVKIGVFPLAALGRARTLGRTDGKVKVIAEAGSDLVLGVGIVGPSASDLIAEGTLAVEMGATLEDLMVTIHPHPTLSEAVMEAAEVAADVCVHLPRPAVRK